MTDTKDTRAGAWMEGQTTFVSPDIAAPQPQGGALSDVQILAACKEADEDFTRDSLPWKRRFARALLAKSALSASEQRISDLESDVARLHADKMALLEKYVYAPTAPQQAGDGLTDRRIEDALHYLRMGMENLVLDNGVHMVDFRNAERILAAPRQPGEMDYANADASHAKAYWAGVNDACQPGEGAGVPADSVVVPRKPTAAMLAAFKNAFKGGSIWTDRVTHALEQMLESCPAAASAQQDERDAKFFRWLTDDLAGDERQARNALLERMAVMSYSAACAAIAVAIAESRHQSEQCKQPCERFCACDRESASAQQDERKARSTAERRDWEDGDGRWEVGFRNIVTVLGGARESFEIKEVVEAVRVMTGEPAQGPTPAWWQVASAQQDEREAVTLPAGFSIKRVDGHGWLIDPPSGSRWVAHEGTPAGDFLAALITAQSVQADAGAVARCQYCGGAKVDASPMATGACECGMPTPGQLTALLPGVYYMDLPDGGSVTLLEQLQRMAKDAARYRRIRNGPHSDRHGDLYAMRFMPDGDDPIHGVALDAAIDAAMSREQSGGGDA